MSDLPGFGDKRTFTLDGNEIVLDPANLKFSDPTLNQFFELVSGYCDYYGQKLADANRAVAKAEALFERLYIQKFREFREGVNGESGKSEKTSELYAKSEPEVVKAKAGVHEATFVRDSVWNHLKALNAAREDAHNRGHFLRKELEKLNMEVRSATYEMSQNDAAQNVESQGPAHNEPVQQRGGVQRKRTWPREDDPEMEALFQAAQAKNGG